VQKLSGGHRQVHTRARTHTQTDIGDLISPLSFLESRLKCVNMCVAVKGVIYTHRHLDRITNSRYIPISRQSIFIDISRQPYVGPGLPQKPLPAEVSGYCFFIFRDKCLFQGVVVSPTPNPRLFWRADVFSQDRLP
jgi:hypothetical protein